MSLWCGSCRKEIFEGFGILYRLERDSSGKLLFPDKSIDYIPANSAVCEECFQKLPDKEKQEKDRAKIAERPANETIFAYAPSDSQSDPIWKSKTWSSIVSQHDKLIFLTQETVAKYFPKTLEIIDNMADEIRDRKLKKN